MSWSHWLCDTVTGERLLQVAVKSSSWQLRMNDQIGSGQTVLATRASDFDGVDSGVWSDVSRAWSRTLVACWGGVPVYAGVLKSSVYDPASGDLTLRHAELGELLRRRLFFGAGSYSKTAKRSWTGLSRQGVLVEAARAAVGGGNGAPVEGTFPWRLPVFLPSVIAGTRERETFQHMFERPWDWMTEIPEEVNGEDFVFGPGFNSETGTLQWVMQVGSPMLNRSSHEFHLGAQQSPVVDVSLTRDADEVLTGVFATGEGMDEDIPVGFATSSGTRRMPAMDSAVAFQKVTEQSRLNALASGVLRSASSPTDVWSFKVRAESALAPMSGGPSDGLRPGSRVRLLWAGDRFLGTGSADLYVTGVSGDVSSLVSVEVQSL